MKSAKEAKHSGESEGKPSRKEPQAGDSLTPYVWDICYDLHEKEKMVTVLPVMAELKKLIGKPGCPVVGDVAGGVKFENGLGDQTELNSEALRKRIKEWRKICITGG